MYIPLIYLTIAAAALFCFCVAQAFCLRSVQKSLRDALDEAEDYRKAITGEDMTLDRYQQCALETALYPKQYEFIYPALGMAGEAGEVAEKVKKVIRDKDSCFTHDENVEIAKEVGDVLWCCAVMARDLGYSLSSIAQMNYEKLRSRQQRHMIGGSGDNR